MMVGTRYPCGKAGCAGLCAICDTFDWAMDNYGSIYMSEESKDKEAVKLFVGKLRRVAKEKATSTGTGRRVVGQTT